MKTFCLYVRPLALLAGLLSLSLNAAFGARNPVASLKPARLLCEGRVSPTGVDAVQPRLSWVLQAPSRQVHDQQQTGYQILAASSPGRLDLNREDLWNSGRVASSKTLYIPYGGRAPHTGGQVWWKVRAWDGAGRASGWSAPAQWTAGVMTPSDWNAQWIDAPALAPPQAGGTLRLRDAFAVGPHLRRALIFVCGLGQYEMSLNGRKAGDAVLTPGWTDYRKTCLYDTYDVTLLLHSGRNAVGLLLGNGMYNVVAGGRYTKFTGSFGPLKAIALIRLEYDDGRVQTIGTNNGWRAAPGPITFCSIYGGEDYDARLTQAGWDTPGFDASAWTAAQTDTGPGGKLCGIPRSGPPVRVYGVLRPVADKTISPGVHVYDLGQNASILLHLAVQGPAGAVVRVTPAELLHPDGTVDRDNIGGGLAYWQYTLAGAGREQYQSRFFYQGARYLQVQCTAPAGAALPVVEALEGQVIHADCRPVGTFACSNPLFNRISALVRWAQKNNMVSIMTDCPTRERLGWLEEDHLNGPALRYDFDMAPLFAKVTGDMADSQLPNGLVPSIAPEYPVFGGGFRDSPEWGSATVLVPWQQYEFDDDLPLLRQHYEAMARYVAYLGSQAHGDIVNYGLGDWYDLGPNPPGPSQLTPIALTATAFYYKDSRVLSEVASLLGKPDDAARYRQQAEQIRDAFNAEFYHSATGQYATGSQTSNAIPLVMGLCPAEHRAAVLEAIVRDVQGRGDALTSGDVGYRYLLRALADGGRSDVVYAMNNQSGKPGYGDQLAHGATSLTEAWDANPEDSQDHFMLGQIIEWFYRDLAGIQCDPTGPGFSKIIIKPAIIGNLTWVKGSYDSAHGLIRCGWMRHGTRVTINVTIPPNTTATVYVPAGNGTIVHHIGSGTSQFSGIVPPAH